MTSVSSRELGKAERFPDAAGRYIEFCKSTIPHRVSFKGMKVVVDCANGAAYHIAPDVFHELGADVVAIANSPDGFNINDACGSTHPEQLQKEVMRQQADIGIALDGDGDRVLMVDGSGNCVDGDQILYVMARTRRQSNRLYGGVMGTLMSNLGLEKACEHMRIPFKRSAVGDRYVLQGLRENHWTLGGETSGHIICLDKSTTGDGIIAALEVVHAMVQSATSLADLCSGMHRYPQQMINVTVANGSSEFRHYINDDASVCAAIADAESRLAGNGRVVLRPSGTEPVIRVMVEGDDALEVDHISQELAEVVKIAARS